MGKTEEEYRQFRARLLSCCQLSFFIGQLAKTFRQYDPDQYSVVDLKNPEIGLFGSSFPAMGEELEAVLRWAYYGDYPALNVLYDWYHEKVEEHQRLLNPPPSRKPKRQPQSGFIYVVQAGNRYKIGKSRTKGDRVATHMASSPLRLQLILEVKVSDYTKTEQEIHACFAPKCIKPEWFTLNEIDLQAIREYLKQREVV